MEFELVEMTPEQREMAENQYSLFDTGGLNETEEK